MNVDIQTEIARGGFVDGARDGREIRGDVVSGSVFADVAQ